MKLYYSAGACSTSCHISLEESQMDYTAIPIDWDNTTDPNIALVEKLNLFGTLPVAVLDSGIVLAQNISIHTYIAEHATNKTLFPKYGTEEYTIGLNWLSYVAADLHKSIGGLFAIPYMCKDQKSQEEISTFTKKNFNHHLNFLNKHLIDNEYLLGKYFSIVDSYAFVVLGWTKFFNISLTNFPNVEKYLTRIGSRPAVQKVLKEEGLL